MQQFVLPTVLEKVAAELPPGFPEKVSTPILGGIQVRGCKNFCVNGQQRTSASELLALLARVRFQFSPPSAMGTQEPSDQAEPERQESEWTGHRVCQCQQAVDSLRTLAGSDKTGTKVASDFISSRHPP